MNSGERARAGGAGDLGRRVRRRRSELGLSVAEVARRAGMDSGYLEYLEGSVGSLTTSSLLRLAAALETTADALAGGGIERPPGGGGAGPSPTLEELETQECLHLIQAGGVGRIVFLTPVGPSALPVNFRLVDGDIVFRTAEGGTLDRAVGAQAAIGFEVDHLDEALAEGWSVLIHGHARPVSDEAEVERFHELQVEPWPGGERDRYLRLAPTEITGRRIRVRR